MFIVVGTTNVDFFLSGVPRIPAIGKDEFTADNFAFTDAPLQMVLGGNGGNSAYALARLGAPVLLCSALGEDLLGAVLRGWLEEAGVDTSALVRSPHAATSSTTIISDLLRNRLSFHHRGASAHFEDVRIPQPALGRAHSLLVASYSLLLGWRPDGAAGAFAAARQAGCVTALDIGPAIGEPVDLAELSDFLPDVDYFLCNEHELATCTGTADLETGVHRLLQAGAQTLVLKQGRSGATIYEGRAEPCRVPAFPVTARSTVGAGDSFNAGLLFALQQGWALQHAVRFANAVAALVVGRARGGLGAPRLAEVEQFLSLQKRTTPTQEPR